MKALNGLRMDAAAGPDKVSVKMLKDVDKHGEIMASVASVCCINEKFPEVLQNARTVLLLKKGDPKKMTNWRGISIRSAIRRCISKALCHRLNMYVDLSEHQKDFRRLPGLLENVARLQGILTASVEEERGVSVAFLDISKAFDNVGHEHVEKTLSSFAIAENLRRAIGAMYSGMTARVEVGGEVTGAVPVKRGVLKGDPLSPLLLNLTINFLLHELNDFDLKKALGLNVNDILALSAFAFADDLVIARKNRAASRRLSRGFCTWFVVWRTWCDFEGWLIVVTFPWYQSIDY
ncbi:hypothetical protein RvY_10329 [Ramazzottius varieornatus]|uniref:Reverse transcriptase domain-containing protein n=1 Tax=Ramazzottius varieornatus TaxID=947166 RepID=A0A1D1VCE0_RAMVA|nr:hypothetical protein RvY_10329 [Ramazzottius varieornatus]